MKPTQSETELYQANQRTESPTASKLKFVLTSYLSNGDERKDTIWMIGCRQNQK